MGSEADRLLYLGKGINESILPTRPTGKAPQSTTDAATTVTTSSRPKCSRCGMTGHTDEKCWSLHPELKPDEATLARNKEKRQQ